MKNVCNSFKTRKKQITCTYMYSVTLKRRRKPMCKDSVFQVSDPYLTTMYLCFAIISKDPFCNKKLIATNLRFMYRGADTCNTVLSDFKTK